LKPIYQLYDEWLVRHQQCKLCDFSVIDPVRGPTEDHKLPATVEGLTMEEHIRKEHPKEVKN